MSAAHWGRVVHAGLMKNWRLTTTYPTWVLNRLVSPVVAVALAVFTYTALVDEERIRAAFVGAGESAAFEGFLILGQTVFAFFMGMNWRGGMAIQRERWQGTLEMIFLTPASRVAFVLAESLYGLLDSGWTVFLAMMVAFFLFGAGFHVAHPAAALLAVALTLAAMVALGLFFAGFYVLTRAAGPLSSVVQAPVGFLSGVQFPLAALPSALQAVSYVLPVTYGVFAVRRSLLGGEGLAELAPTLAILAVMTVAFAAAGTWLLHRMEVRAKRTGSLHAY